MGRRDWRILEWGLFAIWLFAGVLTMYPTIAVGLHLRGTLFTSYAADLTCPAWMYVVLRRRPSRTWVPRWLVATPTTAALTLFVGSTLTELSQIRWPRGVFRGVFDPWDIVAYATGILACYLLEATGARIDSVGESQGEEDA